MNDVVIYPTGLANIASVERAFVRAGASVERADAARDVARAARLVLPGVGAFAPAVRRLEQTGVADALRERIAEGRPTLAICLGLQLLLDESEEAPGERGLGVVPGRALRFRDARVVPHMGWNEIVPDSGCALVARGHAYFANSYRLAEPPEGFRCATSVHGERFVAAVERGCLVACQFHPELSGSFGRGLLERWLALPLEGGAPC